MSPCCTVNLSRLSIERGVGRQVILEPSPRERWVTGEVFAAPCAYEFEESAFADTQGDGGVRCSELHELVRPCCDSEPAASARICFCGSVIGSPLLRSEMSRLSIERDVGRQVVLGPLPRECLGDWGGVRRLRVRTSWKSPRFAFARGYGGVRCSELHELVRPCCDGEPAASARICFCGSVIGSPLLRSEVSRLSIERDV